MGQDFVRRTHDLQNEFEKQKLPLRRNFRPTPLLGCRGCSQGQGCVQGGPGVVSVRVVEWLGTGVVCLRVN